MMSQNRLTMIGATDLVPRRTLSISCDSSQYLIFLLAGDQQEPPEQEQILKIMSYSQRGRMDEQRCVLSPVKTGQTKNTSEGWDKRHKDTICIYVSFGILIVDCFNPAPDRFTL